MKTYFLTVSEWPSYKVCDHCMMIICHNAELKRCEWVAVCLDRGQRDGHLPPDQQGPGQDSHAGE